MNALNKATKPAKSAKPVSLQQVLFSQGFGTRRECDALILHEHVSIQGQVCIDPFEMFSLEGLKFSVKGQVWQAQEKAFLMLHKPAGYECSQKPRDWPSVMTLLPEPLRLRSGGGVQPVGRLDADTTGLLLFTDDGALIHRLTSPKKKVPKVYQVTCAEPITEKQLADLAKPMRLDSEKDSVLADGVRATGERSLELILIDGKYHQVKRMLAAVGNHVVALHRSAIGEWSLPVDLKPGEWRWIQS